jgi:hypothetical protein
MDQRTWLLTILFLRPIVMYIRLCGLLDRLGGLIDQPFVLALLVVCAYFLLVLVYRAFAIFFKYLDDPS